MRRFSVSEVKAAPPSGAGSTGGASASNRCTLGRSPSAAICGGLGGRTDGGDGRSSKLGCKKNYLDRGAKKWRPTGGTKSGSFSPDLIASSANPRKLFNKDRFSVVYKSLPGEFTVALRRTAVVAIISPHYSGRRGCAPQVVRHGFRPAVSIWLISFHIHVHCHFLGIGESRWMLLTLTGGHKNACMPEIALSQLTRVPEFVNGHV